MPNPKFHIWQGSELRAGFYSSDHKELSIVDKRTICKVLKTRFETAWFAPTHESMLSLQLPEKPTFTEGKGQKAHDFQPRKECPRVYNLVVYVRMNI